VGIFLEVSAQFSRQKVKCVTPDNRNDILEIKRSNAKSKEILTDECNLKTAQSVTSCWPSGPCISFFVAIMLTP